MRFSAIVSDVGAASFCCYGCCMCGIVCVRANAMCTICAYNAMHECAVVVLGIDVGT